MAKKRNAQWDCDTSCEFKGVSLGDSTATVAVNVSRDHLSYEEADELLCGRQVKVQIANKSTSGNGELPGLQGASVTTIDAIAKVKKFSVTPKVFGFSVCFDQDSIDVRDLAHFPKRTGEIRLKHQGDLKPEENGKDADGGDD